MADNNNETSPAPNPDDPLRWDMKLPGTDEPLCWGDPRATWGGKVSDLEQKHKNMAQQNIAELRVTPEWMGTFLGHVNSALTMLREKGVGLTADQRSILGNIGLNNLGMVEAGVGLVRDNPGWFPTEFDRQEVLDDWADRGVWLTGENPVLQLAEIYTDTLQAINSDTLRGVEAAKPYINQGSKLSGASDTRVATYNEYFKRNRPKKAATTPTTPK